MRTLELPAGAAETLARPLNELILERQDALPRPEDAVVVVDGQPTTASAIRFGMFVATWWDSPSTGIAGIAYARAQEIPRLATLRAEPSANW